MTGGIAKRNVLGSSETNQGREFDVGNCFATESRNSFDPSADGAAREGGGREWIGGIASEGPQGELGGSIWNDAARWAVLVDGSACSICERGHPLGVLLERRATWTAERLARLVGPQKVNYEIHGNTLPHLHAHVYARFRGDRFVGGPIDNRLEPVDNVPLDALREALS